MPPDALSVLLRALSFVALLQAAGIAISVTLFARHLAGVEAEVRRLGAWSVAAALPLLSAQLSLEPARLAGAYAGVIDPALERIALTSPAAAAFAVRVLGLALTALGLVGRGAPARLAACTGSLVVAASFALMGHTAVHRYHLLLGPALTTHVLVAAFWLGGVPVLYLATVRSAAGSAAQLIAAFSRVAVWTVPWLAIVGVSMAVALVPKLAVLPQPYGCLLLGKVLGFAVLLGLAAANRSRLGPAVALGATRAFRRTLAAEYVLIVGVLAATATMTSLYSPEP